MKNKHKKVKDCTRWRQLSKELFLQIKKYIIKIYSSANESTTLDFFSQGPDSWGKVRPLLSAANMKSSFKPQGQCVCWTSARCLTSRQDSWQLVRTLRPHWTCAWLQTQYTVLSLFKGRRFSDIYWFRSGTQSNKRCGASLAPDLKSWMNCKSFAQQHASRKDRVCMDLTGPTESIYKNREGPRTQPCVTPQAEWGQANNQHRNSPVRQIRAEPFLPT